jgi:hypothetical protein
MTAPATDRGGHAVSAQRSWQPALLTAAEPGRRNRRTIDGVVLAAGAIVTGLAAVIASSAPAEDEDVAQGLITVLGWAEVLWRFVLVSVLALALIAIALALVVSVVAVLAVPKLRAKVVPGVRSAFSSLWSVARDRRKRIELFGGNVGSARSTPPTQAGQAQPVAPRPRSGSRRRSSGRPRPGTTPAAAGSVVDGILAWDSRRGGTHARESSSSFDSVRFGGLLGEDPADDVQHTKMCGSGVVQPDEAFYSAVLRRVARVELAEDGDLFVIAA